MLIAADGNELVKIVLNINGDLFVDLILRLDIVVISVYVAYLEYLNPSISSRCLGTIKLRPRIAAAFIVPLATT